MCPVLPAAFHSFGANFARAISRKFERGRFLIIGAKPEKLERQFTETGREAVVVPCSGDLAAKLGQGEGTNHFETAVWFYSSGRNDDDRVAETLSGCADSIVLMPGPGAESNRRRPELVECFARFGFLPDYGCDLIDLDPGAVCLRHQPNETVGAPVAVVETAFARLNVQLSTLQRELQTRASELEGAHRHIAALEEKLLKLKEYRGELRLLKEQKQMLRKSPERRVGQVLLAPYRLPERVVKTIWKKLRPSGRRSYRSTAPSQYQQWFQGHRATARDLEQMRHEARVFASSPLISVITPVFNTPVQHLEEAVESVLAQAYENWELLLIDDGSTVTDVLEALPLLAARDRRIVMASLKHKGISAASNQGLALARGDWVAFLDHDDLLEPDALFHVVKLLQMYPDADLIYSDEDKLGDDGFEAPLFKPDWSPDFFLSYNYLGHLTAVRRDIVQKAGGFRSQFDSAQDYDLFFRVIEQTNRIHHIPRMLYHWRRSESSSAISVRQKPEQLEASRHSIEDHLRRTGEPAHVSVDWRTHAFCVRRGLLDAKKVSIIVPGCHGLAPLERCIESLTSNTSYPNYEIVIVHGSDQSPQAAASFSHFPHRLLCFSSASNESALKNFAAKQTDSPWLLLLNDNMEIIEPDWLAIMAEHVQRQEVGAVGARLLNRNDTIEQAGIVLGVNGIAQPAFRGFPAEHPGANRQLQVTHNCSAVSSACMLARREIFQQAGGFDENLQGALADVDLCLKMRRAGYLIVYTPFAKLYWHEAQPDNIDAGSEAIMRERWAGVLQGDPYYNPNLSRERADFSLGK